MIQTSKINYRGEDRLKLVFAYDDISRSPRKLLANLRSYFRI